MTTLAAVLKTKIDQVEAEGNFGKFIAEPLEPGMGVTLGNALRRVLLSSLTGAAITWVRIDGVQHEYSTLPHMKEDIIEFLLNVKAIRLHANTDKPGTLRLEVSGEGKVTAADINANPSFTVVNPELHLATLDAKRAKLGVEFNVERGRGYQPGARVDGMPIGTLPVDAIFTPVIKVNYTVEHTRVEQITNYDRLVLEVWTDNSILPLDAVRQAAQILVDQFFLFCTIGKTLDAGEEKRPLAYSVPAEQYNTLIEKLNLSPRTLNCLKRSNINKVGEVLERSKEELLQIRNFGEKSLAELYEKLSAMGFLSEDVLKNLRVDEKADAEGGKKTSKALRDLSDLKKAIPVEEEDEERRTSERR